eukprot:COSAG06_NODE_11251_length_1538_cov_1.862404_1_plen_60_part_10
MNFLAKITLIEEVPLYIHIYIYRPKAKHANSSADRVHKAGLMPSITQARTFIGDEPATLS